MYLDQIMQFSMGTLFEKSMLCILGWFGIVHCDICDYNQWIKQECSIVFESVWVGGGGILNQNLLTKVLHVHVTSISNFTVYFLSIAYMLTKK